MGEKHSKMNEKLQKMNQIAFCKIVTIFDP